MSDVGQLVAHRVRVPFRASHELPAAETAVGNGQDDALHTIM